MKCRSFLMMEMLLLCNLLTFNILYCDTTKAEDRYPESPTLKQSPNFSHIFCLIADMIASRTHSYILNNYPMVIRKKNCKCVF